MCDVSTHVTVQILSFKSLHAVTHFILSLIYRWYIVWNYEEVLDCCLVALNNHHYSFTALVFLEKYVICVFRGLNP